VVLGPDANRITQAFAYNAGSKGCGYLDFRKLFYQNPYEVAAFSHMGFLGMVRTVALAF
jgi:hypothetical protein